MKFTMAWIVFTMLVINTVHASVVTNGTNGINSTGLLGPNGVALTGDGIGIGQVEPGRPGKSSLPPGDSAANSNTTTLPTAVFVQNVAATANDAFIEQHSQQFAGVMISSDATDPNMDRDIVLVQREMEFLLLGVSGLKVL
jgi:hypothetical protein